MQLGVMVFGCVKRKLRCVSVQDYFYDSASSLVLCGQENRTQDIIMPRNRIEIDHRMNL